MGTPATRALDHALNSPPTVVDTSFKMAAFIKAANAKIRSNPMLDYVCSTHFWGPVSNFGIPVAAVLDTKKSPDLISGQMTGALCIYSATFMRYSLAVSPRNWLLFGCHFVNGRAADPDVPIHVVPPLGWKGEAGSG